MIPTYSPDRLFWGMDCCDDFVNIVVNPYLYLKIFLIIDPMDCVELAVRYVLGILFMANLFFPLQFQKLQHQFPTLKSTSKVRFNTLSTPIT